MPAKMNIAVRVPAMYRDAAGRVNTRIAKASRQAGDEAVAIVQDEIRLAGAIATFDLFNGVRHRLRARGSRSAWYTREVYFVRPASRYWRFVDEGTRPHFAPIAPFIRWAAAKGLPAFMAYVARAIVAEEGTEATHFMRFARARIQRRARQIMAQALRDVRNIIKGRG